MAAIVSAILVDIQVAEAYKFVEVVEVTQTTQTKREVKIEVVYNWDKERIIKEIRDTFPEAPDLAVAIAKAESELNAKAYNPEAHRGCNGSVGIMQIACVHHRSGPRELHDVELNLKKARAIYDASLAENGNGWLPWGAYTDERYKAYLE